ncbi:hypothetical protein IWW36_006191 [Coemansia brasiliensis]|uniref:Uncharacterized protein n=1 Tax=Coemansia brasiliensis TaxID=2650707 RepID=A0A9W8I2G1_9FUNG|nr:hypothetical protein IWW36_006191 [Coemansia brasiliensis]
MKSRIMEMAQRIAEEDEYDDTYDDIAPGAAADPDDPIAPWEELLVNQYISDQSVFERNKDARKSAARQALRDTTGLSDEQLEGWFIMLQRNPHRQRVLHKYESQNKQALLERPDSAASSDSKQDGNTNKDFKYKEKNKSKVANHDRKRQHSRKMQNA